MTKNKRYYFLLLLITAILSTAGVAYALEIKYPTIPGLPDLNTQTPTIPGLVKYYFGLGIYLAGVLSLISFTIGAVGLISPALEAHNDAKDRMKGAVLGLALTLVSFVMMQTINPAFTTITIVALPNTAGVVLINKDKPNVAMSAPSSVGNISALPKLDDPKTPAKEDLQINAAKYNCTAPAATIMGTSVALAETVAGHNINPQLVWIFPKPGLEEGNPDLSGVQVKELLCGDEIDIPAGGSYKIEPEVPGVYFFLDAGCSQYASDPNTSSTDQISSPFNGKIKGVKILNDSANKIQYGVIFHKEAGLEKGGECTVPIVKGSDLTAGDKPWTGADACTAVPSPTSIAAANIFRINTSPETSSGNGVFFYSDPWGWTSSAESGIWPATLVGEATYTSGGPNSVNKTDDMKFDFTGSTKLPADQNECSTFKKCPRSMLFNGSYLVGLYSGTAAPFYCQTFTDSVQNLGAEPITKAGMGSGNVDNVYIIPLP